MEAVRCGHLLPIFILLSFTNFVESEVYELAADSLVIPTSVSMDQGYSMEAEFMVDGNEETNSSDCQCCASTDMEDRPGFTLHLNKTKPYRIAKLHVIGRSDSTIKESSLNGLRVYQESRIGPMLTLPLAMVTENTTSVWLYPGNVIWNSVLTLQIEGRSARLTICELKVYSGDVVSIGSTVTMSSTLESPAGVFWSGERAVLPGATTSSASCSCCAATLVEDYPWLQLDFDQTIAIQYIDVLCADSDPAANLIDVAIYLQAYQPQLANPVQVFDGTMCQYHVTISPVVTSRYVTLIRQRNDSLPLIVCDIKVYRKECPPLRYGENCELKCGHCVNNECDVISGHCVNTCVLNTGEYPFCKHHQISLEDAALYVGSSSPWTNLVVTGVGLNWLQLSLAVKVWLYKLHVHQCAVNNTFLHPTLEADISDNEGYPVNGSGNTSCVFLLSAPQFLDTFTVTTGDGTSLQGSNIDVLFTPVCDQSFYGPDCQACSRHCRAGTCDPVYGHCTCLPGYMGRRCTAHCEFGTFGEDCLSICRCWGGMPCDRVTGHCPNGRCDTGYRGHNCSELCPPGSYGPDCSKMCPEESMWPPICVASLCAFVSGVGTLVVIRTCRSKDRKRNRSATS